MLSSFFLHNSSESSLDWIATCDKKWVLYDNRQWLAQWLDQEEGPNHLAKPNTHQRKAMVTIWWFAAGLIHYGFLNPSKPLYLRSMLSTSMRCIENCSACSQHWSTKWAQFFFKTMPDCRACHTSNTAKAEQIGHNILTHRPFLPKL